MAPLPAFAVGNTFLCETTTTGDAYNATAPQGNMACGTAANANGADGKATAVGLFSQAVANSTTSLGALAQTTGDNSTAIGSGSRAGGSQPDQTGMTPPDYTNTNNTAVGQASQAGVTGDGQTGNTAIGQGAISDVANGTALGQGSSVTANGSVALGQGSVADTADSVSVGDGATNYYRTITNVADGVNAHDAVTVEQLNSATANPDAVKYDDSSHTSLTLDSGGAAVGIHNVADGTNPNDAVNYGQLSQTNQAVANLQTEINDVPIQATNSGGAPGPSATGAGTVSAGYGATTGDAQNASAYGQGAQATSDGATAIGQGAVASGDPTTAVGTGAQALSNNASAFGAGAVAGVAPGTGDNATAIGEAASATGLDSTAIGQGAVASFNNSTAIGQGAVTTRANQVAVGASSNTYTLSGLTSAASLAAQNGTTNFVTTDANGNLAESVYGPSSIASLDASVAGLQNGLHKAYEGTAIALAMAGASLPEGKRFAISANWGTFEGENGFAANGILRVNDYVYFDGGIGVGADHGTVGGRAGVTLAW